MNNEKKYQIIRETVTKYNSGQNPSYEDINTAFSYCRELTETRQYPGSDAEARQIGATLSVALSNSHRD